MVKSQITTSAEETQMAGQNLARQILAAAAHLPAGRQEKHATVLCLQGNLGAGKTTFLQGFAKGLGIEEVVNSPTFVIMKSFKLHASSFKFFYHIDLYRLETEKDIEFLNLLEIISNPENIVSIEWPEKIAKLLPENIIKINLEHLEENKREITADMF